MTGIVLASGDLHLAYTMHRRGRGARSNTFAPKVPRHLNNTEVNADQVRVWQFKINCLPVPVVDTHASVPVNRGKIDHDLARHGLLTAMW